MARTKKITTIEEEAEGAPEAVQTITPPENNESGVDLSVSERLAEIRARGDCDEVTSRIYELTGNKGREFVGKLEDIVEEDYLAENFGPGKYLVLYTYRENGARKQTSQNFAVSSAYKIAKNAAPVLAAAQPQNGLLAGLLGNMTPAEKVTAAVAIIEGVKKIFAPPPPPVDLTELLKAMAAQRGPAVGDAVLIKALEGINRPAPAPAPSILTQIKEIQQVKELLGVEENAERGGDTMSIIVEQGLKLLPLMLLKNGGNYKQTGADVRNIPQINSMIENDPGLVKEFLDAVAANDKYGLEAAQKMAEGFGYSYEAAPDSQNIIAEAGPAEAAPAKG